MRFLALLAAVSVIAACSASDDPESPSASDDPESPSASDDPESPSASDDPESPPVRVEAVDDRVERVTLEDGSAFFFRFVDDPTTENTMLGAALSETVVFKASGCVAVAGSAAIWPPHTRFGPEGRTVITPNGEEFGHGTTIEVAGGHVSGAPYSAAVADACDPRTPMVLEIGHAS